MSNQINFNQSFNFECVYGYKSIRIKSEQKYQTKPKHCNQQNQRNNKNKTIQIQRLAYTYINIMGSHRTHRKYKIHAIRQSDSSKEQNVRINYSRFRFRFRWEEIKLKIVQNFNNMYNCGASKWHRAYDFPQLKDSQRMTDSFACL